MEFNSSIIKGLPPKRSLTEIRMAKGHLQSHERNGEVECVVTATAFYSTETASQRVVMIMTGGQSIQVSKHQRMTCVYNKVHHHITFQMAQLTSAFLSLNISIRTSSSHSCNSCYLLEVKSHILYPFKTTGNLLFCLS